MAATGEVTRILADLRPGEAPPERREIARRRLFEVLYSELRDVAGRVARREGRGVSLQPTTLIHEAFLRLVGDDDLAVKDRGHFLAVAATVMRHVLVDHVRARRAAKRGGEWARVPLDNLASAYEERAIDLERFDAALRRLAESEPRGASIVDLHFFGGLSLPEVARVLDASLRTVEREWQFARAWLRRELG